ncbi:MAG: hypothetical protein HEQ39_10055 [Rhizobacter sp.]
MSAESNQDWHLDRRIQITHILGTWVAVASAVLYVGEIRKDVEVVKMQIATQAVRDNKQDIDQAELKRDLQAQLEKIDAKLDRLIEAKARGAR